MNKFYLFAILFFALGVFSVSAQDMIVLTNGNTIEAKVEEITSTEIKYRRFGNMNYPLVTINRNDVYSIMYEDGTIEFYNTVPAPPALDIIVLTDGNKIEAKVEEITPTEIKFRRFGNMNYPLVTINRNDVYSIMYEDGTIEFYNTVPAPPAAQVPYIPSIPTVNISSPVLDPYKFYWGLSVEPAGFLSGGPSVTAEFSKGTFNMTVSANFPTLVLNSKAEGFGMGLGVSTNYVFQSRIGGLYIGAMLAWSAFPYLATFTNPYSSYNWQTDSYTRQDVQEKTTAHNFILALNAGYRFVTASRMYFRTGASIGVSLSTYIPTGFYFKPDLAAGYIF
jgi:hypothetical protein